MPVMDHRSRAAMLLTAALALAGLGAAGGEAPAKAAVFQRSIVVNSLSVNDRWKCTTVTRSAVYVATGNSETRTQAKLAPYATRHISCRQRPPVLFGGR